MGLNNLGQSVLGTKPDLLFVWLNVPGIFLLVKHRIKIILSLSNGQIFHNWVYYIHTAVYEGVCPFNFNSSQQIVNSCKANSTSPWTLMKRIWHSLSDGFNYHEKAWVEYYQYCFHQWGYYLLNTFHACVIKFFNSHNARTTLELTWITLACSNLLSYLSRPSSQLIDLWGIKCYFGSYKMESSSWSALILCFEYPKSHYGVCHTMQNSLNAFLRICTWWLSVACLVGIRFTCL